MLEANRGELNLIKVARDYRDSPLILDRPEIDDDGNLLLIDTGDEETPPVYIPVVPSASETPTKPSEFLSRSSWLNQICSNICGVVRRELSIVDDDMKLGADYLALLLKARLEKHIKEKISNVSKHDHWCLEFTRCNLPRFAAMLVFFGHAMSDPSRATENTCLLRPPTGYFLVMDDAALEGCYVVHDSVEFNWIRSGKACGSNMSTPRAGLLNRWTGDRGHSMKAKTVTANDTNLFAFSYPSWSNPKILKSTRRGYFEDLVLYGGMSFDRDKNTDGLISSTDGIFSWSTDIIEQVEKMNEGSCTTIKEKQLVIVSYFLELCYDICLSPSWNISQNPGFESRLHIFNNAE